MGFRNKTQGPDFFEDFTSQARQLVQAVEFLTHIYAASPEERIALRDQLHEVEHRGDELNHAIVLLVVYGIADIPSSLVSLLNTQIEVIKHCADLTAENMPKLKSPVDMRDYWIEINRLENEGDLAYRRTLTALFDSGLDPVTIIKLKDIVQGLESCADAFEELANVIESLALKES